MCPIQAQPNCEAKKKRPRKLKSATRAVRAALATDEQHGAVIPPLHLSSNFTFSGFDQMRQYDYTRSGNPTRSALGQALAELEGGHSAVVVSSGMAAVTLVTQLLEPGQLLVAPHDCYGGTYRLFRSLADRGAFRVEFVDQTDDEALAATVERGPALVWVETPSNPLLRIVDLEKLSGLARQHDALLVVDNTFLSPVLQQPFRYGADLVIHSTTKYLNGHSDVVGGAVVARTAELGERMQFWSNCLGLTGAPFDSYLTLRGLRTLHARWRQHDENCGRVLDLLTEHSAVRRVFHPSLESHPGHEIAKRQQAGFGAMLSFELEPCPEGGETAAVERFLNGLRCLSLAESLGGVESLIAHPATMTHASMDAGAREAAGIGPGLLRLSVGIEDPEDLVADLEAALDRAFVPAGALPAATSRAGTPRTGKPRARTLRAAI